MNDIKNPQLPPMGRWEPNDPSFIKVRRALLNPQHPLHPMFRGEKVCWAYAWLDLVGMARWQDGNALLRGQLAASVSYLSKRWNRSESWVRKLLTTLEKAGLIHRRPQGGHKPSVISIRNYDYYNGEGRT
jgi:hypothetical protein